MSEIWKCKKCGGIIIAIDKMEYQQRVINKEGCVSDPLSVQHTASFFKCLSCGIETLVRHLKFLKQIAVWEEE